MGNAIERKTLAGRVRMITKYERIIDTADRQKKVSTTAGVGSDSQHKGEILGVTISVHTLFEHGGFAFNRFQPSGDRM